MVSVVEIFTICVLLLFGAPGLSGKSGNGTIFKESVQAQGYDQASGTVSDQPQGKTEEENPVNQHLIEFDDNLKNEHQNSVQIKVREDYETDLDDLPMLRAKLETRQTSNQGPILGLKKGSLRVSSSMSKYFSKASSLVGRKFSRKSKQAPALKKQKSGSEELVSAPKSDVPQPPPRTSSWPPKPWVPPRKEFEPFCLAAEIKEIVMIPGSGEFVYDTLIIKKTPNTKDKKGLTKSINENNVEEMSDAMLSLNQLKEDLPNVEWMSIVVNWFADSTDIRMCEIYPAIEFRDGFFVEPEEWYVSNIRRQNARLISRDNAGNARYGGTVSDGALMRYIKELHRRGYKVMLYPMLVLDTEEKEWRGRLTGPPQAISRFFKEKYNPFIKHYADIARETKADAFIIGSEFVGLTKMQDRQGHYPAVLELVKLAEDVKNNLGKGVIVTYAADWTEYHIASDGRYPLDKLWGSKFIDVVGINAYFPLTDDTEPEGGWSVDDIIRGWTVGEGISYSYDYSQRPPQVQYYDDDENSKWAWKNIEKWWSELHYASDDTVTLWPAGQKKIWFTEFRFPSVDACTSEPYLFVGTENRYPRYSKKKVSFTSQRRAIEATIKKWRNSKMVERMFLYAWDARPFPYFPVKREIWADGVNWERGHWVQGKIGMLLGDKREAVVAARHSLSLPRRSSSTSSYPRVSSMGSNP